MRAWLLLLAVLATFKPIVQVASTEDITSRFIQAISSPTIEQQKKVVFDWNDGEGLVASYDVNRRVTRKSFNNTQQQKQLETIEKNKRTKNEAISPVIDITSLSVTKTTSANKDRATETDTTTSIASIFSYKSSDSDTYNNNNNNNLIKISAKDNKTNKSEKQINNALKSTEYSEVRQSLNTYKKSNKQNKNKFANFNEVSEEKTTNQNNIVRTQKEPESYKVQHLTNTKNKIKQIEKTRTKNTSELQQVSSLVNSEVEKVSEEEQKENKNFNKMAINDNRIEMREQINKRQRHHNQHHHRKHHQDTQQQITHQKHIHHKLAHTAEELAAATAEQQQSEEGIALEATNERLALKTEKVAVETIEAANNVTHIESAERLAQESALDSSSSSKSVAAAAAATSYSTASTTTMATFDDESAEVYSDENEPATYSNKEIIGEKLKPDPSTLVQIENSLLSLFNMKRPPKIDRSKIIIPEAMKQLYAQIMGHELDTVMAAAPRPSLLSRSANTVRSFTHIESKIDDRFPHHHRFRLYFDVKSIPTEEKLRAAELQLSRDAISDAVLSERLANRTRYQVIAYDITRVGIRGKRDPSLKLLDNKIVQLNSTEIVSLNVQKAVNRWLATPKKNFGILIEVRTTPALKPAPRHHVRLRRSIDEPHDSWQHKQPVLYAYTDDGKHKTRTTRDTSSRSKRAGHHRRGHRRKNSDEICRRHSLYVDFADVGWSDWIVAPPGYDAFYCQGKCPFPLAEHMNSTNHAVVQTLVNNLNPGKVPKACCVPTQLEGISMLYLNDQNTVVLKNYQDMTVVGCGCR